MKRLAMSKSVQPRTGAIHCGCGACGEETGRKAVGVDPDLKASNLARLKRIEGQVRGLHKMIEADRYCADIVMQLSAVQESLRSVGRELMRNHLRHCARAAIKAGGEQAESMYDELVELMHRAAR